MKRFMLMSLSVTIFSFYAPLAMSMNGKKSIQDRIREYNQKVDDVKKSTLKPVPKRIVDNSNSGKNVSGGSQGPVGPVGGNKKKKIGPKVPGKTYKTHKFEQGNQRKIVEKQCNVCLKDKDARFFVRLDCCKAEYCAKCMGRMVFLAIQEKRTNTLKCSKCNKAISRANLLTINNVVAAEKMDALDSILENERLEKIPGVKFCSTPNCTGYFINKNKIKGVVTCNVCKKQMCSLCCSSHSIGTTCETEDNRKLEQWAKENGVKKCPGCQKLLERNEGCNHMTCRCGCQFCYQCNYYSRNGEPYEHHSYDCNRRFDGPPPQDDEPPFEGPPQEEPPVVQVPGGVLDYMLRSAIDHADYD